jgi:hypothetical protein
MSKDETEFMRGFGEACGLIRSIKSSFIDRLIDHLYGRTGFCTVDYVANGPWSHWCRSLSAQGENPPDPSGYENGLREGARFYTAFCGIVDQEAIGDIDVQR